MPLPIKKKMWRYLATLAVTATFGVIYRRRRVDVADILKEKAGVAIYHTGESPADVKDHDIVCHVPVQKVTDEFLRGSVGFSESYMKGWWTCQNLKSLLEQLNNVNLDTAKHYEIADLIQLGIRRIIVSMNGFNEDDGKLVAVQHYDLPREIYRQMLDPTMSYSCAYFTTPESDEITDDLEQAQRNKIDLIARKMDLQPGMKVLDIGCGWGHLADHFATTYDVEVVGVTISKEQFEYCQQTYSSDQVRFELKDYRHITETEFDRIVSVGMFEHVTSANYDVFFEVCQRVLKPKGLILLHTITGNTSHRPGEGNAFIMKYIFPNSQLPSLAQITAATSHKFVVEDAHNFGLYYAKTLEKWRENFDVDKINLQLNENNLEVMSDEFVRMWQMYLLMSQVGFESRKINLHQFVLSRGQTEVYQAIR